MIDFGHEEIYSTGFYFMVTRAKKAVKVPAAAKRSASNGRFVALPESARSTANEVLSSNKASRDFLMRAGIVTPTGRLTKKYS